MSYKKIKNVVSVASDTTPNPTGNYPENEYYLTALAGDATFAEPSGTPANGNTLVIRVKDDGTSRTLAWNAIYDDFGGTIPTATTISKTLYIMFVYNSASSKWEFLNSNEEA